MPCQVLSMFCRSHGIVLLTFLCFYIQFLFSSTIYHILSIIFRRPSFMYHQVINICAMIRCVDCTHRRFSLSLTLKMQQITAISRVYRAISTKLYTTLCHSSHGY